MRQTARTPYSGNRMAHPWLDAETYSALENAATRRGEHIDAFAAKLLTRIVSDKLYNAVLDEE